MKNGVTFSLVFIAILLCQDTALHFHTNKPYSTQASWRYSGVPVGSHFYSPNYLLALETRLINDFSRRGQEETLKPMDPFPTVLRFYDKNEH